MSLLRNAIFASLLLGSAACASSVRIGGNSSASAKWEYRLLYATQLADLDPAEMATASYAALEDPGQIVRVSAAVEKGLNELGEQGWELVSMDQGNYVFRRPLTD